MALIVFFLAVPVVVIAIAIEQSLNMIVAGMLKNGSTEIRLVDIFHVLLSRFIIGLVETWDAISYTIDLWCLPRYIHWTHDYF